MNTNSTSDEINMLNVYKELYLLNNHQITSLCEMQQTILQKITAITSRVSPNNIFVYTTTSSNTDEISASLSSATATATTATAARATATQSSEELITITQFGNLQEPLNLECPINFETFSNDDIVSRINSCGHVFGSNALTTWIINNNNCPVCRQLIDRLQPHNHQQQQQQQRRRPRSMINSLTEQVLSRFFEDFSLNNITFDISGQSVLDGITNL